MACCCFCIGCGQALSTSCTIGLCQQPCCRGDGGAGTLGCFLNNINKLGSSIAGTVGMVRSAVSPTVVPQNTLPGQLSSGTLLVIGLITVVVLFAFLNGRK